MYKKCVVLNEAVALAPKDLLLTYSTFHMRMAQAICANTRKSSIADLLVAAGTRVGTQSS